MLSLRQPLSCVISWCFNNCWIWELQVHNDMPRLQNFLKLNYCTHPTNQWEAHALPWSVNLPETHSLSSLSLSVAELWSASSFGSLPILLQQQQKPGFKEFSADPCHALISLAFSDDLEAPARSTPNLPLCLPMLFSFCISLENDNSNNISELQASRSRQLEVLSSQMPNPIPIIWSQIPMPSLLQYASDKWPRNRC